MQDQALIRTGHFGNFLVEKAKKTIDHYYEENNKLPEANDKFKRVHLYHIAECMVEHVEIYTDNYEILPPCRNEELPVDISFDYTQQ